MATVAICQSEKNHTRSISSYNDIIQFVSPTWLKQEQNEVRFPSVFVSNNVLMRQDDEYTRLRSPSYDLKTNRDKSEKNNSFFFTRAILIYTCSHNFELYVVVRKD